MESFPKEINRSECYNKLQSNQQLLIKEVRQSFYETIEQGLTNHNRKIVLIFPEKLWQENRVQLSKELLERFGEIIAQTEENKFEVTQTIDDSKSIPANIKTLIIQF